MSDHEIRDKLDNLTHQVQRANAKSNHTFIKTIFNILGSSAVILMAASVIYFAGKMSRDIEILKENAIPRSTWDQVKNKLNDTYNKAFYDKDTRYQTRGGEKATQ